MNHAQGRREAGTESKRWTDRAALRLGLSGRAELFAAGLLLGLLICFKLVNTARYKFDTDESQHARTASVRSFSPGGEEVDGSCLDGIPSGRIQIQGRLRLFGPRRSIAVLVRFGVILRLTSSQGRALTPCLLAIGGDAVNFIATGFCLQVDADRSASRR
jgi:hypothetical protein